MNAMEFVNKVRKMRAAQRVYFRDRLRADLIVSKQLEGEVDKALADGVTLVETRTLTGAGEDAHQSGFDEPLDGPAEQRSTDGGGE